MDARSTDHGKPLFPSVVIVDNHRACNAACRMCPTQQQKIVGGGMPEPVFDAMVRHLKPHTDKCQLVLFGVHGEPLLDKRLEDRVAVLVDAGIKNVHINTNGSGLTPKRARKFIEAGTGCITISIDGISPETYEAIRIGLKFETVMNNIVRCMEIRDELRSPMQIVVRLIAQTTNMDEVNSWRDFWKSRLTGERDAIEIIPIHNWAYAETPEMNLASSCSSVFDAMIISHNGSVPLCCLDHEATYKFGNILTTSIEDIFNNEQFTNVRQLHNSGRRRELPLCDKCDRPETRAIDHIDADYLNEREKSFEWSPKQATKTPLLALAD